MSQTVFQDIRDSLRKLYLEDSRPWLVGLSGGKDSTMLASLVFDVVISISIEQLAKRGFAFHTVAARAGAEVTAPLDLPGCLAVNASGRTRRQRADRVKKQRAALFNRFAPEGRVVLDDLSEKHAADGELPLTRRDVLKLPRISERGEVNEIVGGFGGPDQLPHVVTRGQPLVYAGWRLATTK